MANIEVTQPHSLELPEVKSRMESVQSELTQKYGLEFNWESDSQVKVSGKGVKGTIVVDGSKVEVKLDLSLLLRPMKGKIESRLTEQLAEKLK